MQRMRRAEKLRIESRLPEKKLRYDYFDCEKGRVSGHHFGAKKRGIPNLTGKRILEDTRKKVGSQEKKKRDRYWSGSVR